ncbi:hypothetical protein ZIOFF_000938 [Zingiber officinale]|uniref:Uncharacterized protein n=1 Tax=Zingiber officinale TaxID=94328 RepID=A0A8J5M862_ZINOF|nr:hypothetical protein ZIOFF_000938 [Zingiber officinale]
MEGGKKKSSSIADDLSPSGKSAPPPSSNLSASSPSHFSGVFPPPSAVRPGFRFRGLVASWLSVWRENLTATNPKRKRCRARMANLSSPVLNTKNRPILAHPFTTVAGISMTALHPTNLLELQNLIKIHMTRERIPMIPTLPTEVNGGKVLCTTEASNLMISSPINQYRKRYKATSCFGVSSRVPAVYCFRPSPSAFILVSKLVYNEEALAQRRHEKLPVCNIKHISVKGETLI